ncbi:MAG: ribonuclease J [Byssovorax sp.]
METRQSPPQPVRPGALRLVPLGGLGEIGMNCLCLEQDDGIVLIDCGVTFPSTDLGIDVYHPRFDYLLARSEKVLGVVLTHGHEDHIGALPYLLGELDIPVHGPPHALELARGRLEEHGFTDADVDLVPTRVGKSFDLGPFSIEPIRVTHSITDATALAIRSAAGLVVHTGDFKLDPSPPDGELTDEDRLSALGDEGVRMLLSDSTNVDSPGASRSEREVGEALEALVRSSGARVILGVFASNVQRLKMIGEIAQATGRRICLLGRSVQTHVRAAQAVGKLRWPSDLLIASEQAASTPRERLLVLASGTQAERMSTLTRLAAGTHPVLRLSEGDRVLLSSRIIPGNDRPVADMVDAFLRLGVEVMSRLDHPSIHASGHAHRDEQRRMIELTRPRAFLPVHGTLHHLMRHAALARDTGVGEVLVAENGEVVEVDKAAAPAKAGRALAGRVATFNGEELGDEVLRDRAQLGRSGVVFVAVLLDKKGQAVAPPQVSARGVIEPSMSGVLRKASSAAARAIADCEGRLRMLDDELSEVVRLAARRAIEAATGRKPVVVVTVARI